MTTLRNSLFLAVALAGFSRTASANAFNINEHDARVTGRGGATAASNEGPSSIVFNPGGIAIGEGTAIAIGGSLYMAEGAYEGEGTPRTATDGDPAVVPSFYVTSRVSKRVALGLGFHLPFGLAVSWPDNHAQAAVIQDQSLRTYFISPAVGVNLGGGLSFGAGVDIVPATIELESMISFGDTKGTAHLGGNTVGIGGRAGLMYHPRAANGRFKIGVMYRSPIKLDFKGGGDFDIAEPYADQLPDDGPITAAVTLPQSVAGGIAFSPLSKLEIEVNAVWINWAQAFPGGDLSIKLPNGDVTSSPQNYKNTVSYRFGIESALTEDVAVRAGFVYDPSPIPDATLSARLPDIDRKSVTIGGSSKFGGLGVHLAALWLAPGKRSTDEATFKGTYSVEAFVLSVGISGQFGGKKPAPTAPRATVAQSE
jgi:long-chain fatty acid transport protein